MPLEAEKNGNGEWPGFQPTPDFTSMSDARLKLQEGLLDENIRWSEGDPLLVTYYEQQMRALQAERKRRNGGAEFVSSPREINGEKKLLTLQTWGAFLAADFAETPYTIQEIAPDSGLIAFHGRGKDGKTTFLIHACRAVATGEPFLEKATVQKPIVYLNYEMGFSYLQKLLKAGGKCPEEAYILNRPEPILQIPTVEALIQQVRKPGLMVIDSFRGAFRLQGDAENSAGGAGVILRELQDLAVKHKWLIIVIHHKNRSQKEGTDAISGTSDWIAAPDVIWTWSRPDKHKPGTLHIEGRMPPVDPMAVELSPEQCLFKGTLEESQEETDKTSILSALTEEGQPADKIAEAIERPSSTVRKRLEDLFKNGLASRDGEGKRASPYLYSKVSSHQNILLREETNSGGLVVEALNLFPESKVVSNF